MKFEVILEKLDNEVFGRIENDLAGLVVSSGKTINELKANLLEALELHFEANDEKIDLSKVEFIYKYDIQTFFEEFNFLKINAIAKEAHMNASLLRRYKMGDAHPSDKQKKRIEIAVHSLAHKILTASL